MNTKCIALLASLFLVGCMSAFPPDKYPDRIVLKQNNQTVASTARGEDVRGFIRDLQHIHGWRGYYVTAPYYPPEQERVVFLRGAEQIGTLYFLEDGFFWQMPTDAYVVRDLDSNDIQEVRNRIMNVEPAH